MYLSILALPLLGAITSGLLGRKLGVTGAQLITCACMITAALLSIVAFYEVALCGSPVSIHLSSWIDSGMMSVDWAFMFDSLTVSMWGENTTLTSLSYITPIVSIGKG
jgi:NADH-ubiquinone oxidoreductase chain 5